MTPAASLATARFYAVNIGLCVVNGLLGAVLYVLTLGMTVAEDGEGRMAEVQAILLGGAIAFGLAALVGLLGRRSPGLRRVLGAKLVFSLLVTTALMGAVLLSMLA